MDEIPQRRRVEKCPVCDAVIKEQSLEAHLRRTHGKWPCPECGRPIRVELLSQHVKSHKKKSREWVRIAQGGSPGVGKKG